MLGGNSFRVIILTFFSFRLRFRRREEVVVEYGRGRGTGLYAICGVFEKTSRLMMARGGRAGKALL